MIVKNQTLAMLWRVRMRLMDVMENCDTDGDNPDQQMFADYKDAFNICADICSAEALNCIASCDFQSAVKRVISAYRDLLSLEREVFRQVGHDVPGIEERVADVVSAHKEMESIAGEHKLWICRNIYGAESDGDDEIPLSAPAVHQPHRYPLNLLAGFKGFTGA